MLDTTSGLSAGGVCYSQKEERREKCISKNPLVGVVETRACQRHVLRAKIALGRREGKFTSYKGS